MTKEEINLLMDDLTGRIGSGTKVWIEHFDLDKCELIGINVYSVDMPIVTCRTDRGLINMPLPFIKPYLLPLSSMNENQKNELMNIYREAREDDTCEYKVVDIYNRCHLDYRNLIGKDLAIDATELNIY